MKFVYLEGPYAEFRGIPFVNGKPVSVLDQGTIDALLKRQDYRRMEDEKETQAAAETVLKAEVSIPPPLPAYPRREILKARRK